jgi:AcrR family transcriptional regulator
MPPRRRSPAADAERPKPGRKADPGKRAAILEAALDLFVERGFHGTAVPSVAERAGVGAGTIYRYFESKEALVNELYRERKTALTESVLTGMSLDGEPREVFGQVFRRLCAYVEANAKAYAFLELHHHAAYLDADSRAVEAQVLQLGTTFVRGAQQAGLLRPGAPGVLLSLAHGAFVGFVRGRREGWATWSPEDLRCAEAACWDLVAGRGGPDGGAGSS